MERRNDELGRLAATFDAMLDRLQDAFARERQFISDASHELKTPLTVINANAQLIRRWGDRDARIRAESLDAIIDESRRLAEMVNGMLTLAKADSGDQIPKEPLAIEPVVVDVVAQAHERARQKGLELRAEFRAASAIVVMGDGVAAAAARSKLVDNAIKFTERGSVSVRLGSGDGEVVVEVRDTGSGSTLRRRTFIRPFFPRRRVALARGRGDGPRPGDRPQDRPRPRRDGQGARRPEGGSVFIVRLPRER